MKIGVVGLGYLGLTHAVAMAELGHEVIGIETSESKLEALKLGAAPFFEPGLQEGLSANLSEGRLLVDSDFAMLGGCDVVFVCVGTPQAQDGGAADLSQVEAAFLEVSNNVNVSTLLVGKSTVPVGTSRKLIELISHKLGKKLEIAWNPEFLQEGRAIEDSLRPNRLVFGVESTEAENKLRSVFNRVLEAGTPLVVTNLETAELVKVAANAFLATKISFINAMGEISEKTGGDVIALAEALGHDSRIGKSFLRAGLGFGGGCLPKDIRAFQSAAEDIGASSAVTFLAEIDQINLRRRARVIELAAAALGIVEEKRILVLGTAFKPGTDDMRDSPSLEVALRLQAAGAEVTVHDPVCLATLKKQNTPLLLAESLEGAFVQQDLIILGTEWAEYKSVDPVKVAKVVRQKKLIDGRNFLDLEVWKSGGWEVAALGRNV